MAKKKCKWLCFDEGVGSSIPSPDELTKHLRDKGNPHELSGDKIGENCPAPPELEGRLGLVDGPHLTIIPKENGDFWINGFNELCIRSAGKDWRLTEVGWTDT